MITQKTDMMIKKVETKKKKKQFKHTKNWTKDASTSQFTYSFNSLNIPLIWGFQNLEFNSAL